MTTRTELSKLVDVPDKQGKVSLMEEIKGWDEDEACFKGRDLWIRAVKSCCEGGSAFRDDTTVYTVAG